MSTTQSPPGTDRPADGAEPAGNPYVGPRSFRYGERLHGRDVEIAELRDVLIAQRIVLLYSPSGAGKSSLLEAGLRPELERLDFRVLPTVRVGHEVPPSFAGVDVRNRYVLSTLLSLEEGRPPERQMRPADLAQITIDEYLGTLVADLAEDGAAIEPCLLVDQFEEVFTLDPTDQDEKQAYLAELGVALRDRGRWALVAMREDFIAQLDPYLALIPKRFAARYRLDLLGVDGARLAMRRPAEEHGRPFAGDASERLLDDLRRMRVQRSTGVVEELGPYVEPVQLQVVCRQLWSTLPDADDGGPIGLADVEALGRVDDALAAFYDGAVTLARERTGARERAIRAWFEDDLISESGFRSQVLEGPGEHGAAVLRELENAHVIRADSRRGVNWYEISHDRLVAPILASNAAWRDAHLSTLQREAPLWEAQGRPAGLLISGEVLAEARAWAEANPHYLMPVDRAYLDASEEEAERIHRERKAGRRNRMLAILSTVVGIIAVVALVAALVTTRARSQEREDFQRRQTQAVTDAVVTLLRSSQGSAPSLGSIELPDTDLRHIDLSFAGLAGSVFDRARLTGANLSGGTLTDASLVDSVLIGADLEGADLEGADLTDANLALANFTEETDVRNVTWTGATCPDATSADAHGGSCEGHLDPNGGVFSGEDFVGLDLSSRELTELTFGPDADLRLTRLPDDADISWDDVRCPNGEYSSNRPDGTCVGATDLAGGDYFGMDALGMQFGSLDLSDADFREANLRWSGFDGTYLAGADLTDADLSDARLANLTETDLEGVRAQVATLARATLAGVDVRGMDFGDAATTDVTAAELVCADGTTRWTAEVPDAKVDCSGAEAVAVVNGLMSATDVDAVLDRIDDPTHFAYLRDVFSTSGAFPEGLAPYFDPPLRYVELFRDDDGAYISFGLPPGSRALELARQLPEEYVDVDDNPFGYLVLVPTDEGWKVEASSMCDFLATLEPLAELELGRATEVRRSLDTCIATMQEALDESGSFGPVTGEPQLAEPPVID